MEKASTFVGLDVHKETIDVTIAEAGAAGEVRHFGTIGGDLEAVAKLLRRLRRKGRELKFVYEAGPCGFEIYRFLREQEIACAVVSPSQIPRRSGDRIKTDRRDSETLARLHRAGELAALYVPEPEDESIRDLARTREDIRRARHKARQQAQALLLRHGRRYTGNAPGPSPTAAGRFVRSPGRRKCGSALDIVDSLPAASRTRSSSPPSLASSLDSSGPSLAPTQPTAEEPTTSSHKENCRNTTNTELSDGIVGGAATVRRTLAIPFPGSATSPRPSLERGSSETTYGLAVTNPRISAGSTVVSTGAALGGPIRELGQQCEQRRRKGRPRTLDRKKPYQRIMS